MAGIFSFKTTSEEMPTKMLLQGILFKQYSKLLTFTSSEVH